MDIILPTKYSDNLSAGTIVTSAQMRAIESLMFNAGMPVEALMEKVAGLIARKIEFLYPLLQYPQVGILVGNGHNGGDALVVARELWHRGREIKICLPSFNNSLKHNFKPLTAAHWQYLEHLGFSNSPPTELAKCDLIIDGLFGCGLERAIASELADIINEVNSWELPIVSIDLPSGMHTDTGEVMGTTIKASHTLCLGLWKRGLFNEDALAFIGNLERIDFNIPAQFIRQVLDRSEQDRYCLTRISPQKAIALLSSKRPITTHKYQMGHLLLIGGSRRYAGAVILAALGARATGVGMLSIAVPVSLRDLVVAKVPEALVIACSETATGAIAHLPDDIMSDLQPESKKYTAIACGVGISLDAINLVEQVLSIHPNLVLDADALSLLAQLGTEKLRMRSPNSTILTPHWGEFCRLFPLHDSHGIDRLKVLENAASANGAVILLKGARTAISFEGDRKVQTWINPESTPALARGGSGDVLTGIIGGLLGQNKSLNLSVIDCAIAATVWHSQTAIKLAKQTEMAVHPIALAENLLKLF